MEEKRTSLEEIVAQHREMREVVADTRRFLELPRPDIENEAAPVWALELTERLARLHEKVSMHFRHEESFGFFDKLESDFPNAEHAIEALRKDHDRILADLRCLLGASLLYGEGKPPPNPHLRHWAMAVLRHIAEHEREETSLLQHLYYQDLGLGD
jgi:hypothetical protein